MDAPTKPCSVPNELCLSDLFACADTNTCGCAASTDVVAFENGVVAEFCDLNRGSIDTTSITFPAAGLSVEQETYLASWWKHLVKAYVSLYERTCGQFHNCCLAVVVCWNTNCLCACDCSCDPCDRPECYRVRGLDGTVFDGAIAAEYVTYSIGGGSTSDAVNLPGQRPNIEARWRVTDRNELCRLNTTGSLPAFPPYDSTLPPGAPGTSILKLSYNNTLDPDYVAAVYELAQQFGAGCSPDSKCSVPSSATSLSDSGVTLNLSGGTPNTSIALGWRLRGFTENQTIDKALIRWGCKDDDEGGFTFGMPNQNAAAVVQDMYWCDCG